MNSKKMSKRNIDWEDDFDFEERKSDNKELLRFIGRILSNWYWFVLCGFIGFAAAYIYLRYTVPSYKIHAKLLVSDDKKGGGMLSSSALGDLFSLMGTKNSVDNEVEVLRTADLMREMILSETAYIDYFKQGRVHDVPVMSTPFLVTLLSNPDSVAFGYTLDINPIDGNIAELSSPDTLFRVRWDEPFSLPLAGLLRIERIQTQPTKENYGFRITPVRDVV